MVMINEEQLLEEIRNPNTAKTGFEKLVAEYSERLYWQIRKMVLSHDDANDILQDTFIKAWMNIDNFRAESKLSTWLYRIAINESITFLNKKRNQNNISMDEEDSFLLNTLESDSYFDGDEAQKLLQKPSSPYPTSNALCFSLNTSKR